MPGLRGNLCWGNRGSFSIYGEYPSAGLDSSELYVSPAPSTYVSTNAYYGHHRLNAEVESPDERMDVSDDSSARRRHPELQEHWSRQTYGDEPTFTRKRLSDDPVSHVFKRIRQDDKNVKEEEDLLFLENYLKQTHGCEYYSYKQYLHVKGNQTYRNSF